MVIRVLLFGVLAERLKTRVIELELTSDASVSDAIGALESRHPQMADWRSKTAFAVNMAYVKHGHRLHDQDELALIPPVSGG